MPSAYDVPEDMLIERLTDQLKRVPQVTPPSWVGVVKTGSHTQRPPVDKDWWYRRCASILRKVYLHGPVGLSELRSAYGGRKRGRVALSHHRDSGGSSIRKALQQLEAAGYVEKEAKKGRFLTSKGMSLVDRISGEIFKDLVKTRPELARAS